MKLVGRDLLVVPREKIVDYLLSSNHRDGRHKAAFFVSFGFRVDSWEALAIALTTHARDHEVVKEETSPFGTRFVVQGRIDAPDGRRPLLRTVWFIENDQSTPRFVTAYPLKGNDDD